MRAEIIFLSIVLVCIALTLSACTPQQIAEVDAHQKDVLITFTTPQTEPQMINTFSIAEKTEIINPYFSIQNSTGELFRLDHAGNFYLYPLKTCGKLYTDGDGLITCGTDADTNFTTTGNMTAGWFLGSFNWTVGDDYNSFDGNTLTFNTSKLSTTYYNATTVQAVRGTPSGTIGKIQEYDNDPYNVTEVAGAEGLDFRINFTGVVSFNQLKVRYKSIAGESHELNVQIYDTDISDWENYYTFSEVSEYQNLGFTVDDTTDHIIDGLVQVRFYQAANGNTGHVHYFDWVTIADGYATPSSVEIDPFSWHRASTGETGNFATTGNVTAGYFCNSTTCYTPTEFLNDIDTTYTNASFDLSQLANTGNINVNIQNISNISNLLIGNTDKDHFIYFYEDTNTIGEYLKWDNGDDRFEFSDYVRVEDGIYATGTIACEGNLYSDGDIYTTGATDNLWLGDAAQTNALFQANTTGDVLAASIYASAFYDDGVLLADTDTNLTEANVEAYIFDADNTGSLTTTGSVTVGSASVTGNSTLNGLHIDKINSTHHKLWS